MGIEGNGHLLLPGASRVLPRRAFLAGDEIDEALALGGGEHLGDRGG